LIDRAASGFLLTLLAALVLVPTSSAKAEEVRPPHRVLRVGEGEPFALPSAAAAAAQDGDRVLIAPGRYRDCAVWRAPRVTIEALPGGAVELYGPVCAGKALLVASAPDLVVVGLTFRGARSVDGNGAGIRAEGGDLTVRNSRFIDNENGILTHSDTTARLVVEDSDFLGNGALRDGHDCAHGLYAGRWALVAIRRTQFRDTRVCHHVKSRALRTEIIDSLISDGRESNASYLIDIPNGGDLLLRGTGLIKGPPSGNPIGAVIIGAERLSNPTRSLVIEHNSFENRMSRATTFVVNRTQVPALLESNHLVGFARPLLGRGQAR